MNQHQFASCLLFAPESLGTFDSRSVLGFLMFPVPTRVNFLEIPTIQMCKIPQKFLFRQDAVPSPPVPVSDSRSALLRQIQVAWEGLAEVHQLKLR